MLEQLVNDKTLLIGVTIIGVIMCSDGIGRVAASGAWLHPLALLAYLFGTLVLVIVGAAVFDVPLPLIDSSRTALLVVIALALAKVGLTQLHRVLALPRVF